MLTIRKLAFLLIAILCTTLFLIKSSTTRRPSPSLHRQPPKVAPPDDHEQMDKTSEMEKILASANRPLRNADEFPSLRAHLEYLFPYQGPTSTRFPAYIWQTWKSTPASGDFDEKFRITEASWTEKHPDYVHEVLQAFSPRSGDITTSNLSFLFFLFLLFFFVVFIYANEYLRFLGSCKVITDGVADILISHLYGTVPKVMEAWFAMPLPILRADFFRYLILLARGGVYADIDTEALKPAHQWLPETSPANTVGLIVGIEADPTRDDWALWYSRRIQFCQWTMRAKVGHPVLLETVARIVETTLARKEQGGLDGVNTGLGTLSIIEWTGPAVWTDSIFWWMNRQTKTGKGTKPGAGSEEWSWVQFTGITEPKVPKPFSFVAFMSGIADV